MGSGTALCLGRGMVEEEKVFLIKVNFIQICGPIWEGAAYIQLIYERHLLPLSSLFVMCHAFCEFEEQQILGRLSFDLDVRKFSPSLFCPRPPLHLPQPSLQDLHLLLEASSLISRTETSPSPNVQQDADTQQDSQSDGHHLRAHVVVAQDEHKTG